MKNHQEKIVREVIREVLIQEGLLDDIWSGVKTGVGKAYDIVAPVIGLDKPQSSVLKALDDLDDETDDGVEKSNQDIAMSQILGKPVHVSGAEDWSERLGDEKDRGINLHQLEDGRNNYRAGISEHRATISPDFLQNLQSVFGIDTVVTLNADSGGEKVPDMVKQAGLESIYLPHGEKEPLGRRDFDRIREALRNGNTLVHCTHGADRTGAVVGRYYIEDLGWDVDRAIAHTKEFGGHKRGFPNMRAFLERGPEGESSLRSAAASAGDSESFWASLLMPGE